MINGVLLYKNNTPSGFIISGNVYNDQNALTGGVDNPVLVGKDNIPTGLKVLLIDTNTELILQIVNVVSVGNYGTFAFTPMATGDYEIRLTNDSFLIGDASPPSSVLPTYWEITGDSLNGVTDGAANGFIGIPAIAANTTANFGIRITPSVTPLNVFSPWDGIAPANAAAMVNLYNNVGSSSTKQMDEIDGLLIDSPLSVSYPLVAVTMAHSRLGSFYQEVGVIINATSQATIRTSIENWIFANNFYGFTYNVGTERMEVQDYTNRTYIAISIPQ